MKTRLSLLLLTFFTLTAHTAELTDLVINEPDTPEIAEIAPPPSIKPFVANYVTQWKVGWFSINIDATRQLKKIGENRWELLFEAEIKAAKLREISEFTLSGQSRIQPLSYQYRASGLFNEGDRTLRFLPSSKSVLDQETNHTYHQVWQDEIHDNLTYMLQAGLDLAAGQKSFEYPVFEKKQSKPFRFEVVGEEILHTQAGTLNTVKVKQIREKKGREIYAWFAIDKNYLLVRLLDKKNGKKRYEINVSSIQM